MTLTRLWIEPYLWTEEDLSEKATEAAISRMAALLLERFPTSDLNCTGPLALGRHCLAIAWRKDGIRVPPAPPEILTLLKGRSPQARHEIFTPPDLEAIPALYEYDLRLAYLWCCKSLPYGTPQHSNPTSPPPHKIEARWAAPMTWKGIGLLPERREKWCWPVCGQGWIDRREFQLATKEGWDVRFLDGLLWPEEGALDRWSDGIQWALRQVEPGGTIYQMLRRVALWTIGSFYRTTSTRHMEGDTPPTVANARYYPLTERYHWTEEVPISGSQQMYVHPEWATTIWARCRARVTEFALHIPRTDLVAIRQDAIYTSVRQPRWEGRDKVPIGGIRLKWLREEEMPAPHSIDDLRQLRGDG